MSKLSYELRGAVAVLTIDNPPVNGLSHAVRTGLCGALLKAEADPAVAAIVLTGGGAGFSGGADIREFGTEKMLASPNLRMAIRQVEDTTKPVIAALHGNTLGGGLELALACHFRVASTNGVVGLPEVKLGLLPGAGGTQRLPRVLGLEAALNIIVSGDPVPNGKLAGTPLFDQLVDGDPVEAAVALGLQAAADKRPLRRVRDAKVEHPDAEALLQFARNTARARAAQLPAPLACVDAVAAAVSQPFDAGQRAESEAFVRLLYTPESRALRHAFFGERAASKIADVPDDTPRRPIARAAVVGAGTMGGGIAMNFANAGIPVTVLEAQPDALERGLGVIRKNYQNTVNKGRLTQEELDRRMGLIRGTLSYDELRDADIVIEAVFEELGVKETVFRRLDAVMKPGAILASNTSTLDLNKIAAFTARPQDVVGLHFFSPANVMKLLEVVRGASTSKDVLATVMALAKKLRKTGVVSGVCDGFIGNRMLEQYVRQSLQLLEEGALPQQVDRALERWGMAMGPFRVGDLAGNDIGWAIRKRRRVEKPQVTYSALADRLCELGRFGQKTGKGWYAYEPGKRDALPDPLVEKLIVDFSAQAGITRRRIDDEEIVHRCIYALVNEGAGILADGIAARASDLDIVYLSGYGFPLHRGGPMLYADEQGLNNVVATMGRFARRAPGAERDWTPAPLLAQLAAEGRRFNG